MTQTTSGTATIALTNTGDGGDEQNAQQIEIVTTAGADDTHTNDVANVESDNEPDEEEVKSSALPTLTSTLSSPSNKPHEDITQLSDDECVILASEVDILLNKDLQMRVLNELLTAYPTLDASFSMVSDRAAQAGFLGGMIRKGYVAVRQRSYGQLYNIMLRHRGYGILKMHMTTAFDMLLKCVTEDKQVMMPTERQGMVAVSIQMPEESANVWRKATEILTQMASKVYKRGNTQKKKERREKRHEQKLAKNRQFIARSMSEEDIECVLQIWEDMIEQNKDAVGEILASKLQSQREIYQVFQTFNIDIFQQSSVLINMLETAIKRLNNTDELIPFLRKLGARHCKMNIKPQWLALMKRVFLDLIKETLGFNLTSNIKQSWNNVMTFIVGIMLTGYAKNGCREAAAGGGGGDDDREYTLTATASYSGSGTDITTDFVLSKLSSLQGIDVNDIESLTLALTPAVIECCQRSWKHVSNDILIHNAVRIFYNDLMATKDEIKALFSRSNMREQSNRLVRAIGSTVELLDEPDTLIPVLQELGKRHVYYNVRPSHFKYVKVCWFKMLKHTLRLQWNKEIQTSWNIAWEFMTYYMKQSLEDALLLYVPPDPVMVNFKVLLNHLDRINVADGSCFIDVWYGAYTGDNSSQSYAFNVDNGNGQGGDTNATDEQQNKAALPFGGVRCLNGLQTADMYRQNDDAYMRYFEEDETWYLRGNLIGEFGQQFDLRAYPFDTHQIDLTFALRVDDSVAMFNADRMNVRLIPYKRESMAGANWTVYDPRICAMEMSAIKGGSSSGRRYTQSKISIPIARKYSHHVYHEIIPLLLMQVLGFAIYFADLFPIAERMTFSLIVFLALCAFYNQSVKQLPSLPYMTVFDWWFYAACGLSLYHMIGLCVVHEFEDELNDNNLRRLSLYIALGGAILFVVCQIVFVLRAVYLVQQYPTKISEFKADNVALEAIAKNVLKAPTAFEIAA